MQAAVGSSTVRGQECAERGVIPTVDSAGEVPEWPKGTVSKTVWRVSVTWVRIPPSPPPITTVCCVTEPTVSLAIRAGRIVCHATGLDGPGAVAIANGRIVAAEVGRPGAPCLPQGDSPEINFPNGVLLPGLVDFHAHPARGGSRYGIDPDHYMLRRGTTTVMSQGDVGAVNWPEYRDLVIGQAQTRVRLAIHLSTLGEWSPHPSYSRLDDLDVDACVRVATGAGNRVWGIAVNANVRCTGKNDPRDILARGIAAAEASGKPIIYGTRFHSDWSLDEQLAMLRPGDVVTYCFNTGPDRLVRDGHVLPCVSEARSRGVLFDVGHGMNSFNFGIAEAALAEGFLPDTISTDLYRSHIRLQPMHDLPLVMSKLRASGMSEHDIWPRVTDYPARILGLGSEIGTLASGACADITVLEWRSGSGSLTDVRGVVRSGGRWETRAVIRAGELVELEQRDKSYHGGAAANLGE